MEFAIRSLRFSVSELFLLSVRKIIQSALGIKIDSIEPEEEIGGNVLNADSLDSVAIITGVETFWSAKLTLERSPTYGFLKLKVKDLSESLESYFKERFNVKELSAKKHILKFLVRQSVIESLNKVVDHSLVDTEPFDGKIIDDKMKLVGNMYLGSESIAHLEKSIMMILDTDIKPRIMYMLGKKGDMTVGQLCTYLYKRMLSVASGKGGLPKKRRDL